MSHLTSGQPIQTTGNNLVGLWRPSFVKVDHRLFVYGGGGNVTNDLHVLNLYDMRWETIKTVKGTAPCKRYGHTATLWNNTHIIVFGGCNEFQEYCNDIHVFDIEKLTWFQPEINGSVPARYLHSAVVYDDKLFIYGGFAKNSECTYVLDELSVLDLKRMNWSKYLNVPPRYNHSATLVGHKMYIYAGKDEHGNTISDLYVINLNTPPYTSHLVLSGNTTTNQHMVLLKSQHFCESICGKLLVFGRYLTNNNNNNNNQSTTESMYGLWMLDLDTLIWTRQECNAHFDIGGWNYFTIMTEHIQQQGEHQVNLNNLFFLGNTDPFRPQGYDHFRDALVINGESLGLYDIAPPLQTSEFSKLLNNQELSDFMIIPSGGQAFHVHQVILITRWPHFRNIYKSGMLESQEKRMEVPERYEVVLAFLKYLYNDKLDESESCQIICEVLVLANMYMLARLKKLCCQTLFKHHLNIINCGLIFEKSILAEEIGLKLLALDFMFKNYGSVLKSNILLHMPTTTRSEFLASVPDNAILDVHGHRNHVQPLQAKQSMSYTTTKPTFTNQSPASLYTFDTPSSTTNSSSNTNVNNTTTSTTTTTTVVQ